jgi:transposase
MANLDAQRMSKKVYVRRSATRGPVDVCGKGRWVLSVDLGLETYATILNVNTGDLYSIGTRAWATVKGKYLNQAAKIQRELDKSIESAEKVKEARKAVHEALKTIQRNNDAEDPPDLARLERNVRECISTSKTEQRRNNPEARRKIHLEESAKARFDSLIKVTARFLSAVGPRGIVCFPTDLCSGSISRGISKSRFGQLLRRTQRDCDRVGACLWKVREPQSSKWCTGCTSYCGYLNLGQRVFKCPNQQCLLHVDRDGGAARSIFILAVLARANKIKWPLHATTSRSELEWVVYWVCNKHICEKTG